MNSVDSMDDQPHDQPDDRPTAPLIGEPILPPLRPEGPSGYEPAVIETPGSRVRTRATPEGSQSVLVFTLGLIGLFVPLVAPVAWYLGKEEVDAIDVGRRPGDQRGLAQAGKVLGMIGSIVTVLLVLLLLLLLIVGATVVFSA